jgi:hypothetical protein
MKTKKTAIRGFAMLMLAVMPQESKAEPSQLMPDNAQLVATGKAVYLENCAS